MGAVAACIRRNSTSSSPISSRNTNGDEKKLIPSCGSFPPLEGQAFCFLPLPVRTQLPLHINAYFELSSNRRDIWRGDDTTGESKVRGQWNDMLLQDVLAPLYGLLLSRAVLYTQQQAQSQSLSQNKLGNFASALLFTENDSTDSCRHAGSGGRLEWEDEKEYIDSLLVKRKQCSVILGLLPNPPPPEPWSILSSALLPLLRSTEVRRVCIKSLLFLWLTFIVSFIMYLCIYGCLCSGLFRFYGAILMEGHIYP